MTEENPYANIVEFDSRAARAQVIGDLDADPEKAAKALTLAEDTGVSADAIYGDLEGFEQNHKAQLAGDLVHGNPKLQRYINKSPMNARLSIDDLANLDEVSQNIDQLGTQSVLSATVEAFKAGYDLEGQQKNWAEQAKLMQHPVWQALLQTGVGQSFVAGGAVIDTSMRLFNAGMYAVSAGIGTAAGQAIGDEAQGRRLVRDIYQMLQVGTSGQHLFRAPIAPEYQAIARQARDLAKKVEPYALEGKEPPLGLDPIIDDLKIEQSKTDLTNLQKVEQAADRSATRERSPQTYADYIREHGDMKIAVSAESAEKLMPLTKDVPGLLEQIELARETGGDVEIPLADWLSRMDPEVRKELHDDVRVRPGGVTKNEAKVFAEQALAVEVYHGSPTKFEAFDSKYMGSGEGAQAYAHGHYLAEAEGVAKEYQQKLSKGQEGGGNLYKATIKREPHEFLDWETTLDSQEAGKVILQKMDPEFKATLEDYLDSHDQHPELDLLTGREFHRLLERFATEGELPGVESADEPHFRKEASEYIKNLGVPGVRFLDQGSRKRGADAASITKQQELIAKREKNLQEMREMGVKPELLKIAQDDIDFGRATLKEMQAKITRNYVVFDEADIEITHRNNEPVPPRPSTPVESIRQSSGLEPLFALGDRKLEVKQIDRFEYADRAINTFDIFDDKGRNVGMVDITELNGGKTLYIENIASDFRQGGPNSWGPSLIKDLLRQIKEAFPNAEELTGTRVSGARDKAGAVATHGETKIKLGLELDPALLEQFRGLVGGKWERNAKSVESYNVPYERMNPEQRAIADGIVEVLERVAPRLVKIETPVQLSEIGNLKSKIHGFFQEFENSAPLISVALGDPTYAYHEALHALRRGKYLTPAEWSILRKGALSEKWIEKFQINQRYKGADLELKWEEAIAEGYREWESGRPTPKELHPIFEKIKAAFEAVKAKLKELFGHEPTWEEVFQKISSGEVAKRKGLFDGEGQAFAKGPAQPELPGIRPVGERQAFEPGALAGVTDLPGYKRYMQLIKERQEADYAKSLEKAQREEKRRQGAEWKAEAAQLRPKVVEEIRNRPDVAADSFLRDGDLYGDTVDKVRLNSELLTPEQREGLPKSYQSKSGAHPDDIAGLFGYGSGKEMVDSLVAYEAMRKQVGGHRSEFVRKLIDAEVERQMEMKHGKLEENILEAAKEQALSETQVRILDEEVLLLAEMAGKELPIPGKTLIEGVKEQFAKLPFEAISSDKMLQTVGKMDRFIQDALLRKDPAEAFQYAQRKRLAALAAREAIQLEKDQAKFDKIAKRYSTRELPKGTDPEHSYFITKLLQEAGYKTSLMPDELATGIDHYEAKTLDKLVQNNFDYGWEPAVVEDIIANGAKAADKMSVAEWREFNDAVTSLDYIGRQIRKIDLAGEKADFAAFKTEVVDNLKQRPLRDVKEMEAGGKWLYQIDASWTRQEEVFKDLDFRQDMGPMFKAVIVPYELSKNKAFTLLENLSKEMKAKAAEFGRDWEKSLSDTIPQDFVLDPIDQTPMQLTRWNLIKMMLNYGNEQNKFKLIQGLASVELGQIAKRDQIEPMQRKVDMLINTHATAKDWQFVQHIWDIFEGFRPELETLQRNTSGVVPKWIESQPIKTPHGEFKGGYFPLIPDRLRQLPGAEIGFSGEAPSGKGPLAPDYFRATTPKGHVQARTGKAYFVDITGGIEQLTGRMQQVIHDLAYRDFVINAGKVLYDPQLQTAIKRYYGAEYQKEMIPWLKRIANELNAPEAQVQGWDQAYRQLRLNLTASVLPLNYTVMFSPTVGTLNPKVISAYLSDRAANRKLVMDHSKELQHTMYSIDRDITSAMRDYTGEHKLSEWRAKAVETMFRGLVKTEHQFRKLTFFEKFIEAKAKGMSDTEAAVLGDSAIRERHGATGIGDLPSMMAKQNEFARLSTLFMGYFTMQRNWMRQIPHQAREGQVSKMAETVWGTIGVAVLFNTLLFTKRKEDENVMTWLARAVATVPLSMVPGVREGAGWLFEGRGATSPIAGAMKSVYNLGKDGYDAYQGKTVKKPVRHLFEAAGLVGGIPGSLQAGRTVGFLHDVSRGEQRPRDIVEWMRGILTGEARLKKR